jgi:putative hydrolase of the HAD superfamily
LSEQAMATQKEIELVLFDIGGVLVELAGMPTLVEWTHHRRTPAQLWRHWLSSAAVRAFETGQITGPQFAEQLIEEMNLPIGSDEFLDRFMRWPQGLYDGARELLRRLQPGIGRATLSNTNALHWPLLMGKMGLEPLFDHHFPSHLTGKIKPDQDAFSQVTGTLGVAPAAVLFLDDNQVNVDAARDYGFAAFQVQGIAMVEAVLAEQHLL